MIDKTYIQERLYLNALNLVSLSGPKQVATLLDHFHTAREIWETPAEMIASTLGVPEQADRLRKEKSCIDPIQEWEKLQNKKIETVSVNDDHYPALLKQLNYPPQLLYYRGSVDKINRPAVAIVGSRRCTFYGQEVAGQLAAALTATEVTIVSGMALGIDTAAHRGSLENSGYTIAVLGCGVDNCYPPQNRALMEQIIAEGAVVSEFPLGTQPLPPHFPRRNRIISGLSLGTVVVEATAKSGALITANFALEQNREVFAVPGNVGSPYSRGSHRLLKEGARLVETASDILEELNLDVLSEEQLTLNLESIELSEQEKKVLNLIPYQPMHIDKIIRLTESTAAESSALLLSLELKRLVRQTPGKYFCRI
jgi:DNA processing protein